MKLFNYHMTQPRVLMRSAIKCLNISQILLLKLFWIFNYIWTTGKFPEDWTLATIIQIPKPGKDPVEPNNYRPIALTSCLCKTLERMINKRLTWFLESNNHISRFQSGFRSDRSTTDNLVRLESFIRDAFIKKEHVVAVFFDLEKAYDTSWRYGILKDIHKLGLRGRLPTFIETFLADRTMQVRVGSSLSDYYDQEQGVPQGGVLSTTLFSIKINNIVKCLGNLTDCSLYVDDFCICYRSKSMATIERQLQQNLNKIKIGQQAMALSFPNQKHSVYISVSCTSNMMIWFYIYIHHLFQLLRNLNSLAFYLIEKSVLYLILNISKLNV